MSHLVWLLTLELELVDQTTIDQIKNKPQKGFVCLQNHGHKVEFKNVRLREIKKDSK